MSLEPGKTLLHYRLVDKMGEGGMGVVWKALDTSLNREVAVKVLAEAVAGDAERLARFDREAKLLASLNHPNIASIYGFHEADGVHFVAMELVPGEDLSWRIGRGALPVDEALEIAQQIADALAAAHDSGVVHRDLKPANVRIAPDGTVKVLDFGLAKTIEAHPVSGDPSLSPTMTTAGTAVGTILGTAAYMSPEQARGRAVDRRADMWAFGCVLYEMLTGRAAFPGDTIPDILAAVIGREPDWGSLPAGTPPATRRLLGRCLQKKPAQRVRDAGDARFELAELDAPAAEAALPAGATTRRWLGALGLIAVTAIATALLMRALEPADQRDAAAPPAKARQVTFTGDVSPRIDLAADGRTAVYLTKDGREVVLLDLDGGGSRTLYTAPTGTTFEDVGWSPDGGRVYLMRFPSAERVLSIPRLGGEPRQELDLEHLAGLSGVNVRRLAGGDWVLYGNANTVYVGDDPAGLEARGTLLVGEGVSSIPGLEALHTVLPSPEGRWLAFLGTAEASGRVAGLVATGSGESPGIIDAWSGAGPVGWSSDGRRVYLWRSTGPDSGDLLRQSIDRETGRPSGKPTLVAPRLSARAVCISGDGKRLALVSGNRVRNLMEISLDETPDASDNPRRMRTHGTGRWGVADFLPSGELLAELSVDRGTELFAIGTDSTRRSLPRLTESVWSMAVSPDGGTLAITIPDPSVLLLDIESGRSTQVDVPEPLSGVAWSPDGTTLAAMTARSADRLVTVELESSTAKTVTLDCGSKCEFAWEGIASGPEWPWAAITSEVDTWVVNVETGALRHLAPATWFIDRWRGDWIYFGRSGGQTDWPGYVLFRVSADGATEQRLLDLPTDCQSFRLAPDGKSVICDLDESQLDVRVIDGLDRAGS